MHKTSALYKELLADPNAQVETRLTIGESGRLADEHGDVITFGGTAILVADSGPDSGYDEDWLCAMDTEVQAFDGPPSVGNTIAGMIHVDMLLPAAHIPRLARLAPYIRLTDGIRASEWIRKGTYFLDCQTHNADDQDIQHLYLDGYDAMIRAEAPYPSSKLSWPAVDIDVVQEIAQAMGVSLDPRTVSAMTYGYRIPWPNDYSQREVLGFIAAMYGGNFLFSDYGELWLAQLAAIPVETRCLIDESGYRITFGGDRILV